MPSERSEQLIVDLTPKLLESMGGRKRKLGRYSAGDVYKLITPGIPWGLTPEKYFEVEETTPEGALRMLSGIINHEQVQRFLTEENNEVRHEYYFYGPGDERNFSRWVPPYPQWPEKLKEQPIFTLGGKADHLFDDDTVWEIKTSDTAMSKAKAWHTHQTKLYCTIFKRSKGFVLQPLIEGDRLILKEVGYVERDDEWFDKEMLKLYGYHQRLELILEEKEKQNAQQPTITGVDLAVA